MEELKNQSFAKGVFKKEGGKIIEPSRKRFLQSIGDLVDGGYSYDIQEKNLTYERPTRYKYYFDGLLRSIFDKFRMRYAIDDGTGEGLRYPLDVVELHKEIKAEFCQVQVTNTKTGDITVRAISTRFLSDNNFVNDYMEAIMQVAANEYGCDIEFYETWRGRHDVKRLEKEMIEEVKQHLNKGETAKAIKKNLKISAYAIEYIRDNLE